MGLSALDLPWCREDMKEDTMAMTLLGYRALMAELHSDDLRREARTARKLRAARRRKGV